MAELLSAKIAYSDEDVEDIIEVAGSQIGYWAMEAKVDNERQIYKVSW